jgi:limonene-1,2-epoxide hydrolase
VADDRIAFINELHEVCHRGDYDRLGEFLTEDAVFHMIPLPVVVGIPGIADEWRKLEGLGEVGIEILNTAENGDIVFVERIDTVKSEKAGDGLPVVAVFEFRDGKVAAWRDYFDLKQSFDSFGIEQVI